MTWLSGRSSGSLRSLRSLYACPSLRSLWSLWSRHSRSSCGSSVASRSSGAVNAHSRLHGADRGVLESALVTDATFRSGEHLRDLAIRTLNPKTGAVVIDDISLLGGAEESTERAGVVRIDQTSLAGHHLVVEAGESVGHGERRADLIVNTHLVVGAAAFQHRHSDPIRATHTVPITLVGHWLASTVRHSHHRAVAATLIRLHGHQSVRFSVLASNAERNAVVHIPTTRRIDAARSLPVAGLAGAAVLANDLAIETLQSRFDGDDIGQESVVAGLDEGGAAVIDLHSLIVHTNESLEIAVRTVGQRNELAIVASLIDGRRDDHFHPVPTNQSLRGAFGGGDIVVAVKTLHSTPGAWRIRRSFCRRCGRSRCMGFGWTRKRGRRGGGLGRAWSCGSRGSWLCWSCSRGSRCLRSS